MISIISLFSYTIFLCVMIVNVTTKINKLKSLYILLSIIFGYLTFSVYYSDIMLHQSFPGMLILVIQLIYNIFLIKENKSDKSDLFIYVCSFLLPLYLLNSKNSWDQVIIIALIEIVRLVSSSDKNKRESRINLINFINANFRIFLLVLVTTIAVSITKTDQFLAPNKIDNLLIGIPIAMLFIISFVFMGGINSKVIEKHNIKTYQSKNLLAYYSIYRVIIPMILLTSSKNLIANASFDSFEIIESLILFVSFAMAARLIWNYVKSRNKYFKYTALHSVALIPISLIYLLSDIVSKSTFLSFLIISSLIFTLHILLDNYNVKYKKILLWISNLIIFNTPLSPLFIINIYYINKFEVKSGELAYLWLFLCLLIPSTWVIDELKRINKIKSKNYNNYASSRVIFIILSIILITMNNWL